MNGPESLAELRAGVDAVDEELFFHLRRRFDLVGRIRAEKLANGLPLEDPDREEQILMRALEHGPDVEFAIAAVIETGKATWEP
jgi:chorismate mutase